MNVDPSLVKDVAPSKTPECYQEGNSTNHVNVPAQDAGQLAVANVVSAPVVIPYDGTEPSTADLADRHVPDAFWAHGVA